MSYFKSITQDVKISSTNSSTTNLAAGNSYTFTGTSAATLGVAGIQVNLFADKNCTINIQQSSNGTNWDLVDTYYYTASGSFGVTVQVVSSFVRVVVTTNAETTSTFRLQTVLCPIIESVPRSLDGNGNFKIATSTDAYGFQSENTPMGEQRIIEPFRLIGTTFEGTTIDSKFWTTAATGTGASVSQANAQITLVGGTGASTVTAFTVRRARYVGGTSMRYRAVIQNDAGTANNTRRWGIGWGSTAMPTVTDGAWFQLVSTGLQLVVMKGGSATTITSFNGQLGATFSIGTNVRAYEIYWTNSKVIFVVGDEVLHEVSALTTTWANTMNFHAFMDNVNSGTATSTNLYCRTSTIYRLGNYDTQPQYSNITGVNSSQVLKLGPGVLHSIIIGTPVNNATIAVYDNTTGTANPIMLLTLPNSAVPFEIDPHLPFFNGLNVVPSSVNLNITVGYE